MTISLLYFTKIAAHRSKYYLMLGSSKSHHYSNFALPVLVQKKGHNINQGKKLVT
jgi:hypothetical protein